MVISTRPILAFALVACLTPSLLAQNNNTPARPASASNDKPANSPNKQPNAPASGTEHLQLLHLLDQMTPYHPEGKELAGSVGLGGSSMLTDLGQLWAANFKQFHPKVEFKRVAEGSEEALKALANDPTLVVGVSRAVDERDQALLQSGKCKNPMAIVVATTPMAILVHKDNPVLKLGLTPEQVQEIFAASADGNPSLKTWGQLGIKDAKFANQPIHLYQREDKSGTQSYISGTILGGRKVAKAHAILNSNVEISKAIEKDPLGIGFGELSGSNPHRIPLIIQGQLVPADESSILAHRYPLMRPLILLIDHSQLTTDGGIRESILRYVLSKDGQAEVMKCNFYPLDPSFIRQELDAITGKQIR